ncbi:MAG: DNA ligase [Thermoleophilia bacterium]|nr:DNA ligase [Thermoleophilia bacterium]
MPMLAKLGALPAREGAHAYELKWDGIRAMVYVHDGQLRIESRNQNELTRQYPEFAGLVEALGDRDVVLDAEIVALNDAGVPSFQRLQSRLGLKSDLTIKLRAAAAPATMAIFDVVHLDGRDLTSLQYADRREILASLGLESPSWRVSAYQVGDGEAFLAAVVERGLEGVVVKQLDSAYLPGKRTHAWIKVKQQQRQEFVIGGFTEGLGSRAGTIGALLIGHHDVRPDEALRRGEPQLLQYAGSVGSGLSQATLRQLKELLAPLALGESPFDVNSPGATKPQGKWQAIRASADGATSKGAGRTTPVHYVEPRLVCEVEFTEFTRDGTLRHPAFQGLRTDKDPLDVVREDIAQRAGD